MSAAIALLAFCLGPVCAGAAALEQHRFKSVKSGRQVSLGGFTLTNKDCEGKNLPKAYLVEPPEHGSVCLRVGMIKVVRSYDDPPRHPHCRNRQVRGIRVIYSSEGGYGGKDALVYKIDYGNLQLNRKVDLDVKWEDSPFVEKPGSEKPKNSPQEVGPVPPCTPLLS